MKSFLDERIEKEVKSIKWLLQPGQLIDDAIAKGAWEPMTTKVVEHFVRPGMTCIDIGANMGYYTLLMAKLVGSSGFVLSIEPMIDPFEMVYKQASLNGFQNIGYLGCGLSDEHVELKNKLFNYSWPPAAVEQKGQNIDLTTLDEITFGKAIPNSSSQDGFTLDENTKGHSGILLADLSNSWCGTNVLKAARPKPFIKIDTDGYELKIIRGGMKTLAVSHPTMIIEVCDYTLRGVAGLNDDTNYIYGTCVVEMLTLLKSIGYHLYYEEEFYQKNQWKEVVLLEGLLERFDLSKVSTNLVCSFDKLS